MAYRVRCPDCRAELRLGRTASSAVTVRCPRCGMSFVAELDEPAAEGPAAETFVEAAAARPPARRAGPSWEEPPSASPRRNPRPASQRGLIIGLVSAGCVLLVAVIVVVLILALRRPRPAQPAIVGAWQKQGMPMERVEFRDDGKLLMDFAILRLEKRYRLLDAATLEVEETMFNELFKNLKVEGMPVQFNDNVGALMKHQVRFELNGDELTFAPNAAGLSGTYRRVP